MSPTYQRTPRFDADYDRLTPDQRQRFLVAIRRFVKDLNAGRTPRPGLRVKTVQGEPGVLELTFSPNGRATFEFGAELRPGQRHVIWRRVGTHDVLDQP